MSATPSPPGDPSALEQIDLQQGWQVEYFTDHLGLSREALAKAVESAGPRVQDVKDYLERYGPPATTD